MASVGEDDEYESDPEQAKLSLTMRRREASDDEEEEEEEDADDRELLPSRRVDSRVSDCESDGQGAAAEYADEESDLEEEDEEYEEEVEDEYYEERESGGRHGGEVETPVAPESGKGLDGDVGMEVNKQAQEETGGNEKLGGLIDGEYDVHDDQSEEDTSGRGQEEKKENEPFAVPTAGAFYMHDDRLRESAGGRHGFPVLNCNRRQMFICTHID